MPELTKNLLALKKYCKEGKLVYIEKTFYEKRIVHVENLLLVQCYNSLSNMGAPNDFWITYFHKNASSFQIKSPIEYDEEYDMPLTTSIEKGMYLTQYDIKNLTKNRFLEQPSRSKKENYLGNKEYNILLPVKLLMQMGEPALQKL
ncbi:MAG: hypothetical protein H0T62_11055 [Parachlamydiaceae bacterium]|nr:hypothetical protein [Parachlamydiaceae bacterium]